MLFSIAFAIFVILTIIFYKHKMSKNLAGLAEITKLNGITIIFSLVFLYASATTVIGISGLTYRLGFSGMWTALITASSGYVPLLFLGKKFADVAHRYNAQNFIDLLGRRYDSNLLTVVSAIITIMLVFVLTIAQLVGAKYIIDIAANSNNNIPFFIFIGLACILFVVIGVRPPNLFNALLGLLVFLASCLLVVILVKHGGGLTTIKHKILQLSPDYFLPLGPISYQMSYLYIFSYWIYLGFGILGVPIISFRVVQYSRWLKTALLGGTIVIFVMTFNMAFLGLLSIPLLGNTVHGDEAVPLVIKQVTSPLLSFTLFFIILLTLLGIIKLQLLTVVGAFSSLMTRVYKFKVKGLSLSNNLAVIVFISLAAIFAINYKLNLFNIILFAVGALASAFTWAIVFVPFNYKFVNKGAALTSVIFGITLFSLIYNSEVNWRALVYPAALPVVLNFVVYIIAGYLYYFFTKIFFKIIS